MIDTRSLCERLLGRGFSTFAGVPCSYLDGPIQYFSELGTYVPASNEGSALVLAAGAELGGARAGVLLQNSGLGNLINPLTSLLLPFGIPVLAIASLRGWPGPDTDEPQHSVMGPATIPILEALGVPHWILPEEEAHLDEVLDQIDDCRAQGFPSFLLVPRGSIGPAPSASAPQPTWTTRDALRLLLPMLREYVLLAATGYIAREVFAAGDRDSVFYMQGAMGHALALGLGVARSRPERPVAVIDGDGAVLMHMGTATTAGAFAPSQLLHVLVDNHAYESTGSQATVSETVDWEEFSHSVGYASAFRCSEPAALNDAASRSIASPGPTLLILDVDPAPAAAAPPRATASLAPGEITARFSNSLGIANRPTAESPVGSAAPRQVVHCHPGAVAQLGATLRRLGAESVLLVASDGALERTRVLDELTGLAVQHFSGFEPNPRLTQARDAAALVERHRFDAVVGVGGASTLDVAKLARILPSAEPAAFAALAGDATVLRDAAPLLVLVPTTAGPGAEVTSFAAVYVDGSKHSLDHPRVRADAALVDSDLIHRSPTELLATCALDGLAQSIESVLSLRSTEGSRRLAFEAMPAFLELLPQVDEAPPKALRDASRAGVAVGRAIDVSRTTAGHAFAYPTTVRHGVPHGLACALHLTWILPYFATNVNSRCQDPRGASFVHARLGELAAAAGAGGEEEFGRRVAELIELAGASSRLSDHGIGTADTEALVRDALGSARAANSPVPIDPDDAIQLLRVSG